MTEHDEIIYKILLVDDRPVNIGFVKDALEFSGHQVKSALSGAEALQILAGWIPDFVLLDLEMPNMSGSEVLAEIRRTPELARVSVVIVSAHPPDEVEEQCALAPPDAILSKPIRVAKLRDTLEDIKSLSP